MRRENVWLRLLVFSVLFSLVFTFVDFVVHQNVESIKVVPQNYYVNKIVLSSILFFVVINFFSEFSFVFNAGMFSYLLNSRYLSPVFSTGFFIITLVVHFLILLLMFFLINKNRRGLVGA